MNATSPRSAGKAKLETLFSCRVKVNSYAIPKSRANHYFAIRKGSSFFIVSN